MNKKNDAIYYFGRLNIISAYWKQDKTDFLFNSMKARKSIQVGDFLFGFFEIEKFEYEKNMFIGGLLVKYKAESEEEVVDKINNKITVTTIEDRTIAKSRFIIHPESGLIAYHLVPNRISNVTFKKQFCKLIEEANDNLFIDAEIQAVDDELKIFEAIKKFDIITSLRIVLHPSNPSNRERWRKTDEKLRKMKVEKYVEQYSSKSGIIIDEDDEAYGNIIMASDGYGIAKITGKKDGKVKIASTDKLPVEKVAPKDDNFKAIEVLFSEFKNIFERFNKK